MDALQKRRLTEIRPNSGFGKHFPESIMIIAWTFFVLLVIIAVLGFGFFACETHKAKHATARARAALHRWSDLDKESDRHLHLYLRAYAAGRVAEAHWHKQIHERLRQEAAAAYVVYSVRLAAV